MSNERLQLLIVDDEKSHIEAIRHAFAEAGGKVDIHAVGTLREYRERVIAYPPDIALVDLILPDGRGIEVLSHPPEDAPFPALMMTAFGTQQIVVEVMKAGALDYVVKSSEVFAAMPHTVESALREWALLQRHKHAETALVESESKYRNIIEKNPISIQIVDKDGFTLKTNHAHTAIFGSVPPAGFSIFADLLGKCPGFEQILSRARNGEVVHIPDMLYNAHDISTELPDTPVWIHAILFPLKSDNGEPDKFVFMHNDISERKRAEVTAARLATIVQGSSDAIVSTDTAGVINSWNPGAQKMFGYSKEEAVGKHFFILATAKSTEGMKENLNRVRLGETFQYDAARLTKQGSEVLVWAALSPIKDASGAVTGVSCIYRDISERKRAEKVRGEMQLQLEQSQKMEAVGLLAGGVAHDFNNILTAIKGYCSLVSKALPPEDPNLADMGEIMTAADRATSLTHQLLAFSRKQIMIPQVVDLNTVISNMAKMLRRIIGEDIKLSTKLFSAPCFAKVDPGIIDQVIMNLVLNARDAIANDGEISLETEVLTPAGDFISEHPDLARGRLVCVKVRDNGCGMSPEVKQRVFEPFYTTKERYKGTGLGLSMVSGSVKQSEGEIVVESEPGKGSVFKLYFPFVEAGAPKKSAGKPEETLKTGTETVLLVEDEEPLRRLGERVLRAGGYTVISAADGPAALAAAERRGKPVDLLLTDLVMPGMTGRELALELARRKLALRTLYMSGYTDEAITKQGVLEPGIAFIYKPFTIEALSLKLREVLNGPADQAKA